MIASLAAARAGSVVQYGGVRPSPRPASRGTDLGFGLRKWPRTPRTGPVRTQISESWSHVIHHIGLIAGFTLPTLFEASDCTGIETDSVDASFAPCDAIKNSSIPRSD